MSLKSSYGLLIDTITYNVHYKLTYSIYRIYIEYIYIEITTNIVKGIIIKETVYHNNRNTIRMQQLACFIEDIK